MINDDNKIDELLRTAAQDYNRPPDVVPRDAMWSAIEAARTERALRPLAIVPRTAHRLLPLYAWLGAAAAAVLLVAAGIGIGRWSTLRAPASGQGQAVAGNETANERATGAGPRNPAEDQRAGSNIAGSSDVPGNEGSRSAGTTTGEEPGAVVGAPSGVASRVAAGSGDSRGSRRASGNRNSIGSAGAGSRDRFAQVGPSGGSPTYDRGARNVPGLYRSEVPYQVATIRHLANAEALLTAFRTDSRDVRMDAQLSTWARDLLSNTRLLLDSPAADDPLRAKLLGDLELVLAQIVQLSPSAAAQERELIEGSIRNGQVMTRLRSAIPAGPTRGL